MTGDEAYLRVLLRVLAKVEKLLVQYHPFALEFEIGLSSGVKFGFNVQHSADLPEGAPEGRGTPSSISSIFSEIRDRPVGGVKFGFNVGVQRLTATSTSCISRSLRQARH